MKNLQNFNEYTMNEGAGSWLATAMLLVSLGVMNRTTIAQEPQRAEKIVNSLNSADIDCLKFIDTLDLNVPLAFNMIENEFNSFKPKMENNIDFKDFLKITTKKSFPIKANILKINAELSDATYMTIPLYLIEAEVKDNLKISFSTTGVISGLGLNYKF